MTNINNGGKSPIAGIIHAVMLLLIFLFFMPLAKYIPMACLAGVLVIVSYGMCGWRSFLSLMKNPKSDVTAYSDRDGTRHHTGGAYSCFAGDCVEFSAWTITIA